MIAMSNQARFQAQLEIPVPAALHGRGVKFVAMVKTM